LVTKTPNSIPLKNGIQQFVMDSCLRRNDNGVMEAKI
jgi:hypothetical protein